jgi:hypothetical protein
MKGVGFRVWGDQPLLPLGELHHFYCPLQGGCNGVGSRVKGLGFGV